MGVGLLYLKQIEGRQVGGLWFPKSKRRCPQGTPPSDCGTVHTWRGVHNVVRSRQVTVRGVGG